MRPSLTGSHQPIEWRSERLGRAEWPTPFTTALPELQTTLSKLLSDLKIAHASATLISTSPGSVALVAPIPSAVSPASAEQAARLALTGTADFPVDDAPSDTLRLHADAPNKSKTPASDADNSGPQQHILACADAEERVAALCAMLETVGLTVDRVIPAEAVAIADLVSSTVLAGSTTKVACNIWLGEHFSTIAAATNGRLLFVRTISTGTEMLVDALQRPLRARDLDQPPTALGQADARALLLKVGIPAPDAEIPGQPLLVGSALLPHLQPLVQRLSVEIKQSLRFGVGDAQRSAVQLSFMGPGSVVPNLPQTIARLAGFPDLADPAANSHHDADDSSTGGLIAALARQPALSISLLPSDRRHVKTLRRVRKAILIGSAFAAAFVAYEAVDAHARLSQLKAQLAADSARIQADAPKLAEREQAAQASIALSAVEQRVRSAMASSSDWSPALSALSFATPETIRINTLAMQSNSDSSSISVRGHVRLHPSVSPTSLIREYVTTLQQLPIVQSVTLGATSRASIGGHDAQAFELSIALVPLPPRYLLPSAGKSPVAAVATPEAP